MSSLSKGKMHTYSHTCVTDSTFPGPLSAPGTRMMHCRACLPVAGVSRGCWEYRWESLKLFREEADPWLVPRTQEDGSSGGNGTGFLRPLRVDDATLVLRQWGFSWGGG